MNECYVIQQVAGAQNENINNDQQRAIPPQIIIREVRVPLAPIFVNEPEFSNEQKQVVTESWRYVENHVTEVIHIVPFKYYAEDCGFIPEQTG